MSNQRSRQLFSKINNDDDNDHNDDADYIVDYIIKTSELYV